MKADNERNSGNILSIGNVKFHLNQISKKYCSFIDKEENVQRQNQE